MVSRPLRTSEHSAPFHTQSNTTQRSAVSIRGQVINFLPAEGLVNASNLLKAAGICKTRLWKTLIDCRITITKPVKGYASAQGTYISYQDGLRLCRHINLEDNLLYNIFGNVANTAQGIMNVHHQLTMPSVFIQGHTVSHRPAEKLISATNLLRAASLGRQNLRKILAKSTVTNIKTLRGPGIAQGSYITYHDGLKLCKYLGLDYSPLEEVIKDAEKTMSSGEMTDTPLHDDYVKEGLRDKLPLSPAKYVYIHSKVCFHR